MKVLTTLAEGDYFLGFAALLNSVARFGTYVDRVIVGYRGELPAWLPELQTGEHGRYFTSASGMQVHFVALEGELHVVHEKPRWMDYVTNELAPGAEEYYFFDSDIVLNTRMAFFGEWSRHGICACGDVNFNFHRTHPHRKTWSAAAEPRDGEVCNELDGYYNSGFLGWRAGTKSFIDDWNDAFAKLAPFAGDMNKFRIYDRTYPVQSTNQDSLNLALMITSQPITLLGPDAMGFREGPRLMYHPLGPKPWRQSFVRRFFEGHPPRQADLAFWQSVNGSELAPVSRWKAACMVTLCQLLRFAGRFYNSPG